MLFKRLSLELVLIYLLLVRVSANDGSFQRCNCEDESSFWSVESILECQRVSDFLIAVAYFSIPIELLYFVSCSNIPFKWVLLQFIAFIVLCGLTHFLNGLAYGPHPFQLMLSLTVFKILTALVSCATAITLVTLIPLLLKVKVREFMLKKKTRELGREVGIIMKQKEAGLHVRMLTQEIRKSLDRHTILYTTLVELSKTLGLQNCAVWMPNEIRTEMNLTHELKWNSDSNVKNSLLPITDSDVVRIKGNAGVNILRPNCALASASSGDASEPGPVAAIRMPMLRVCDFKGGTPEMIQACYAVLVLVLPGGHPRAWTHQELEIIKVVADQVAVALSHSAILEESQLMREKLEEQNRILQIAKVNAMMANQARNLFRKAMSGGMKRPMHSILGLISMLQCSHFNSDQQITVDTLMKTSCVLSILINDVMEISTNDSSTRSLLEMKSFKLHALVKEAACLAKCLCVHQGFFFSLEVDKSLPDDVLGDQRRVFQVIFYMIGNLLHNSRGKGCFVLRVMSESGSEDSNDEKCGAWRQIGSVDEYVSIRFEAAIHYDVWKVEDSSSIIAWPGERRCVVNGVDDGMSFGVCSNLAQLMHGNIWVIPNSQGCPQGMGLVIRLQLQPSTSASISESRESTGNPNANVIFRNLHVLLVDSDAVNRNVTKKLLEKLGCRVVAVSSGSECLASAFPTSFSFQIVIVDLQLHDLDGFEVAARIRKFRTHSQPLLVALTTTAEEEVEEKCQQIGINGVIQKPAMLLDIASVLQKMLLKASKVHHVFSS